MSSLDTNLISRAIGKAQDSNMQPTTNSCIEYIHESWKKLSLRKKISSFSALLLEHLCRNVTHLSHIKAEEDFHISLQGKFDLAWGLQIFLHLAGSVSDTFITLSFIKFISDPQVWMFFT